MDLINDAKLIANLSAFGIPTAEKLSNQTSVNFSLSSLIPMIASFNPDPGSKHIFTLKVTDLKGQSYEKALTFYQP